MEHLLLALLSDESLARLGRGASAELTSISADALRGDLVTLTADTDVNAWLDHEFWLLDQGEMVPGRGSTRNRRPTGS